MGIVAKIKRILNKCNVFISFNKSKLGFFLLHFLFKSHLLALFVLVAFCTLGFLVLVKCQ